MKIIHIITSLDGGGAETMLYRLVHEQKNESITNVVISLMGAGKYGEKLKTDEVQVYMLGINSLATTAFAIIRLCKILYKEKPDLILSWLYHADAAAIVVGLVMRIPVIWNLRCAELERKDHSAGLFLLRWLLSKLSKLPLAIISNSESGKRAHDKIGYHPRKWIVIPNGFDTKKLTASEEARCSVRKLLEINKNTFLIGLIARVHPMKDHKNFLNAAGIIYNKNKKIQFILVGKGAEDTNLEIKSQINNLGLKNNVHLLGEQNNIKEYTASLDMLVSSSYSEGFPNVIGEAMACEVPCVVTNVGDSKILVGDTGIVVPGRDAKALADAILKMVDMGQQERTRLGKAARKKILEEYSIPVISRKYIETCEGLLAAR